MASVAHDVWFTSSLLKGSGNPASAQAVASVARGLASCVCSALHYCVNSADREAGAHSAVAADRAQHWSRAEACGALPGAHCSNRAGALLIVDADGARLASLVCFGERQRD